MSLRDTSVNVAVLFTSEEIAGTEHAADNAAGSSDCLSLKIE
jgi:hypothetical protein